MVRIVLPITSSVNGSFHFWKSPEIPWESLKRHVRFYGASAENPELQEPNPHDYETDFVAWSRAQAQWLKAGRFDRLDLEHLADEIEDVGKSEQRELINRMHEDLLQGDVIKCDL